MAEAATGEKAPGAFKTIGELSVELGVAQHILRYWETKFPQLKPLQRAGNRRYYRPDDVALAKKIDRLLNEEGYTVRGVQKLLRQRAGAEGEQPSDSDSGRASESEATAGTRPSVDIEKLAGIRDRLARALGD